MTKSNWFVNIGGETFGPVSSEIVQVMLRQFRLHFEDYIWKEGFTKWIRIGDVDDFAHSGANHSTAGERLKQHKAPPTFIPTSEVGPFARSGRILNRKLNQEPQEQNKLPTKPKVSHFHRVKATGEIEVESYGKYPIFDLSEGGVFAVAPEPIDVGIEVNFTLRAKGIKEDLTMMGLVIRHGENEGKKGFAVEFIRVNPAYKRLLQQFVFAASKQG